MQAYNKQQQQPASYINIVEPDLNKTSLASKQAANSFYFLLLILHGRLARQKKLFVVTVAKEKPTPDVRDDANKSRRNTQNTYTTVTVYTPHAFPLFTCMCVVRLERKYAAAHSNAVARGRTATQ